MPTTRDCCVVHAGAAPLLSRSGACCMLLVACCKSHVASRMMQAASRMLPAVHASAQYLGCFKLVFPLIPIELDPAKASVPPPVAEPASAPAKGKPPPAAAKGKPVVDDGPKVPLPCHATHARAEAKRACGREAARRAAMAHTRNRLRGCYRLREYYRLRRYYRLREYYRLRDYYWLREYYRVQSLCCSEARQVSGSRATAGRTLYVVRLCADGTTAAQRRTLRLVGHCCGQSAHQRCSHTVLTARQVDVLVDEVAKVIAAQKKAHLRIRRRRCCAA